jgi:hypothetical protein
MAGTLLTLPFVLLHAMLFKHKSINNRKGKGNRFIFNPFSESIIKNQAPMISFKPSIA